MDGAYLFYKPTGVTSHDVVKKFKKVNPQADKIGHAGTLDPFAEGLLVILVNKATRCMQFIHQHPKDYRAKLLLGLKTDTADSTGTVIDQHTPFFDNIEPMCKDLEQHFVHTPYLQIPPAFSAVKVAGTPSYAYARKGIKLALAPKLRKIHRLEFIMYDKPHLLFDASVSSGTYIRTLGEDIAEKLGTIGHLQSLQRTKIAQWDISHAITIDTLDIPTIQTLHPYAYIPMHLLASLLPCKTLEWPDVKAFLSGNPSLLNQWNVTNFEDTPFISVVAYHPHTSEPYWLGVIAWDPTKLHVCYHCIFESASILA